MAVPMNLRPHLAALDDDELSARLAEHQQVLDDAAAARRAAYPPIPESPGSYRFWPHLLVPDITGWFWLAVPFVALLAFVCGRRKQVPASAAGDRDTRRLEREVSAINDEIALRLRVRKR